VQIKGLRLQRLIKEGSETKKSYNLRVPKSKRRRERSLPRTDYSFSTHAEASDREGPTTPTILARHVREGGVWGGGRLGTRKGSYGV